MILFTPCSAYSGLPLSHDCSESCFRCPTNALGYWAFIATIVLFCSKHRFSRNLLPELKTADGVEHSISLEPAVSCSTYYDCYPFQLSLGLLLSFCPSRYLCLAGVDIALVTWKPSILSLVSSGGSPKSFLRFDLDSFSRIERQLAVSTRAAFSCASKKFLLFIIWKTSSFIAHPLPNILTTTKHVRNWKCSNWLIRKIILMTKVDWLVALQILSAENCWTLPLRGSHKQASLTLISLYLVYT